MAEKVIQKLDQHLNCAICLDTYTDPKVLKCLHNYCAKCLIKLVIRDYQGQLILTCPTCRRDTPVPPDGVRGLQSAFPINEMIGIRDELKDLIFSICSSSEHAGQKLELFCQNCNEPICYKCIAKGGKHYDHDYDPLDEAFDKYKGEIMTSLEPMEKTITTALAELDTRSKEISDQGGIIEASIHDTTRQLHDILDVRKTELIDQKHCITQRKLKNLAIQREEMKTIQVKLRSLQDSVNERLMAGNDAETLKTNINILKQVKKLATPFELEPNTDADTTFSAIPDITTLCKEYGEVSSPTLIDPQQCQVSGSLDVAEVGEKSSIRLQVINYNGESHNVPIQSIIKCVLVSEITHDTVKGIVERRGLSQYEISYKPIIKGRHQLHIKVEDQHIRGSPFPVAVYLRVEKIGTPIQTTITRLRVKEPWGIAFNHRGDVVVSERGGDCVSIFSPSGKKIRSFGTGGSPCGVAVNGEGNIIVTNKKNHRIQKLTAEGEFITSVGSKGNGRLQFRSPHGITYNRTNDKVYVVDNNHRVTRLNSDLTFSCSFGKKGSGKGQLKEPYDIACDSTGKVYVADRNNHRIQVFTAEGTSLGMFGRRGQGRGELLQPISITIDTSDRVYVGDSNQRISVFTSDGVFITSFVREFKGRLGLAVDASGVLYACDRDNNRIQLF